MTRPASVFVPVEKAVARLINLDYVPEGFSVLDMTGAFLEEAEVEYENARSAHIAPEELNQLAARLEACEARHQLAKVLLDTLTVESKKPNTSMRFQHNADTSASVALDTLSTWAGDTFGIGFFLPEDEEPAQAAWKDVTIKIYAGGRLGWRVGNESFNRASFQAIGLLDKRTLKPNHQGRILIDLALKRKFPKQRPHGNDKTAISRLRTALKQLSGIRSDPFFEYNSADGWRPKFKLIDDRRNADERAKARAQHVTFDETRDYQAECDEAGRWLDENQS